MHNPDFNSSSRVGGFPSQHDTHKAAHEAHVEKHGHPRGHEAEVVLPDKTQEEQPKSKTKK